MNSIYTGVSGLKTNQQAIDVIANNVANINTTAFKAGRISFQETLSRTISAGSAAGTNPIQIGMGVSTGSIDKLMTQGNLRQTDRPLDLAVVGGGFFVVNDGAAQHYTRDGVFQLNDTNQLVLASTGMCVQGWQADPYSGELNAGITTPADISIPIGTMYAVATTETEFGGNLNAAAEVGYSVSSSFIVYDSLGSEHTVTMTFTKTDAGEWSWEAASPDADPATTPGSGTITFDEHGGMTGGTGSINLDLVNANSADDPLIFTVDFSGISQFDGTTSVQATSQNGLPVGILQNYSLDPDGVIYGSFSNGASRVIAQLAMANFANPVGLISEGSNLWNVSSNSGSPFIQTAGNSGNSIRSGFVETSNVDLATEFANLIVMQRGFQANSRSITSSDEMLQEVLNLKR